MKKSRNILSIDLAEHTSSFKSFPELHDYIGGEGISTFLLKNTLESGNIPSSYVSICTGPLSGVFPYASKAILTVYSSKEHINMVGGGKLSSFMNFSGLDSILIKNDSNVPVFLEIIGRDVNFIPITDLFKEDSLGLSGRRTKLIFSPENVLGDEYFSYGSLPEGVTLPKNLIGLVYSPEGEFNIKDISGYNEVLEKIHSKESELLVHRGASPSCYGCPMGCALSKAPETLNVSVLPRSLVSCAYAEPIYNDINVVFSCFNSLGYDYDHEFLESYSSRYGSLKRELSSLIENLS